MKKITLLFALCCIVSFAQAQSSLGKLFVKKIGISAGFDQDRINNMDMDYMLGTANGAENSRFLNSGITGEELYGGVCENPYLRAYVTLGAPALKNTTLDLAVVGVFNRYDGLYYSSDNYYDDDYKYVSLNSFSNEVMIEGVVQQALPILSWFKLYGGIGTNLGFTFGNSLSVNGHVSESSVEDNLERNNNDIFSGSYDSDFSYENYDAKNAFSQRIFAEVGTGLTLFQRFETGLFLRRGVGYRNYVGYGMRGVNLFSAGLRMNWIISK